MTKTKSKTEAACCPECGASMEDYDFTASVTEADFSCRFDETGGIVNEHVSGWSGTVELECGECGWGGDYYDLVPQSKAVDHEEWLERDD